MDIQPRQTAGKSTAASQPKPIPTSRYEAKTLKRLEMENEYLNRINVSLKQAIKALKKKVQQLEVNLAWNIASTPDPEQEDTNNLLTSFKPEDLWE